MSDGLYPVAILAGGLATRLRPVTESQPKSLIEINGEPFIAHQLRLLRSAGARRIVLCSGFLGDRIREYVGDGGRYGLEVAYSEDGPDLQGTGGAIRQALPLLGDRFLVIYGDSYLACDYPSVQSAFDRRGRAGLMTVYRNEGRWDTSNVEFDGEQIRAYDKKNKTPRMRHIDYGLGVFQRTAFETSETGSRRGAFDLALVYQDLLSRNELAAYEVQERFYEIGSFEGIRDLRQYLSTGRQELPKP